MTWDLSIRLYHWLQLICIVVLIVSGNFGYMTVHLFAGLAIACLLVYRLIWALVGPSPARISRFVRPPKVAYSDLRQTLSKRSPIHNGHGPAGGYMVLALWLVLFIQVVSGLMSNDDFLFVGPLAGYISFESAELAATIHSVSVDVLIALIVLHVLAVFWVQHGLKQPVIQAMVHGRKTDSDAPLSISRIAQIGAILVALTVAVALYWLWRQHNFF